MSNYTKDFKTCKEQIELMKIRGIKFNVVSEIEAERVISNINYYKFSGYMKVFEISLDKYDIEFKKFIELYEFDRKFSRILFELIEKIEISFKTNLGYYISERTKSLGPFGYLNTLEWKNYSVLNKKTNSYQVKKSHEILRDRLDFQKKITEYTARNTNGYIESYFNKYKNEHFIPLWILIEVIDFGMATKMYTESVKDIQTKVSKQLNIPLINDLEFYLKSLKLIRNIVAHNGILWNFKLISRLNKPLITQYTDVNDKSTVAVLVVIVEILKKVDPGYDYSELKNLIINYFTKNLDLLDKFGIKNKNLEIINQIL
ncbi:Abi family protein [Cetobacterium sp.]|uniref:Abi family protein n=1 Tax=Cetobacterium sp. TaxID=2071632 RepID=UPI003F34D582